MLAPFGSGRRMPSRLAGDVVVEAADGRLDGEVARIALRGRIVGRDSSHREPTSAAVLSSLDHDHLGTRSEVDNPLYRVSAVAGARAPAGAER